MMLLTMAITSVAQTMTVPQGISYQAVVRNADNEIVVDKEIDVKITIAAETAAGIAISKYTETHKVKTNANGLFTLAIGEGESEDSFSDFNWALPGMTYKITTETEYGTGTAKLLTVPYAMYAAKAGDIDYANLLKKLGEMDMTSVLNLTQYLKKEEVKTELVNYVQAADVEKALADYAKTADVTTTLGGYVTKIDLGDYVKTADVTNVLSEYATKKELNEATDMSGFATTTAVDNKLKDYVKTEDLPEGTDLSGYAKTADVETALGDYAKTADVTDALKSYVKTEDLPEGVDLSPYAKNQHLNDTIDFYVMKEDMTNTLKSYTTTSAMNKKLAEYATIVHLDDTIDFYVMKDDLTQLLKGYVTKDELAEILKGFVKSSDFEAFQTQVNTSVPYAEEAGALKDDAKYAKANDVKAMIEEAKRDVVLSMMEGEIKGKFSVSATKKVLFSQGNLWYNNELKEFKFAEHQYDVSPTQNSYYIQNTSTYDVWLDCFAWGTSGWESGATWYKPSGHKVDNLSPALTYCKPGGSSTADLTGVYAKADWGVFNPISNGEDKKGVWRTLTYEEWNYLMNSRTNAKKLRCIVEVLSGLTGSRYGLLLLPDDFLEASKEEAAEDPTSALGRVRAMLTGQAQKVAETPQISTDAVDRMQEKYGVVFLPSNHYFYPMEKPTSGTGSEYNCFLRPGEEGYYWTSTHYGNNGQNAYMVRPAFVNGTYIESRISNVYRTFHCHVRLVRDWKFDF